MHELMIFVIFLGIGILLGLLWKLARKNRPVMKRCTQCGREFQTGVNGIGGNQMPALCDACAGIERDSNDYIWAPGETKMTLKDKLTGEVEVITRDEAFGRTK